MSFHPHSNQLLTAMKLRYPLLALLLLIAMPALAQERANDEPRQSPNAAVSQTIGTTEVDVVYGRPSVRDRDIFGDLVPYGEVWRTGANEPTVISFSDDVTVEGEAVSAGTYALFTIPGEDAWTVILNSDTEQWGAMAYDEGKDVLRAEVTPMEGDDMEMMTITFEDVTDTQGTLVLHWDDVRVPVTIGAGS